MEELQARIRRNEQRRRSLLAQAQRHMASSHTLLETGQAANQQARDTLLRSIAWLRT